jgi:hypothetical protein
MEPQGRGSAEELGIVQRHAQGCVERLRGLVDSKLPLSALTSVHSSLLDLLHAWKVSSATLRRLVRVLRRSA